VGPETKNKRQSKSSSSQLEKNVIKVIKTSINDLADESGWAFLGEVGTLILKKQPNFDPRNYGYKKLVLLMKAIDSIETDERQSENGRTRHVYVRVKG
jgi:hypothetical protein